MVSLMVMTSLYYPLFVLGSSGMVCDGLFGVELLFQFAFRNNCGYFCMTCRSI